MYPFKNLGLNRNRKIIAVANPSADITQMVAKAVPGVADNYRGVWGTSGTYTNGEMVLYSNVVWLCLASTTTATPATGSTVWQAIGSYSAFLGAWSSSTAYVVGDEVTYGGNFYFCTTANTNQTPSTSSSYWQIAGPSNLDNVPDGPTYTKTLGSVQTGNIPDLGKGILGKHLGNIADDPAGNWRRVGGVGSGNLIGFKSFLGDTSGDNTTSLIDAANKRFLHGAMSGATQNTVAGTADINGSYLQHGVVFQPHIHANQIGWGHFIGDTSGNYTGNLVDGLNLRFLHGAMSTGVQGVISSGSQVNVNPVGGVTGNLPYTNHDVSVRTTLASTAGGDGSYLNPGQVFNRHLNQSTQSGLADDSSAKMFRYGTFASMPAAGTAGRIYHAYDKGNNGITYRDTGTAWVPMAVGHLADINGTTDNIKDGALTLRQPVSTAAANLADNGGFELWQNGLPVGWINGAGPGATPAAAITQDTSPYSGVYCAKITTDAGAYEGIVASKYFGVTPSQAVSVSLALKSDGTHATNAGLWFSDEAGTFKGTVFVPAVTSAAWVYQTATGVVPAGATRMYLATVGPNPGGSFSYWVDAFSAYLGAQTVNIPGAAKAYIDFSDNAANGHINKTQSNVADDANAKMLRFGTLAARPAAGTAGRIYHASDAGTNGITYRDTGSAWVGMAVGHLADINGTLDNTSDGSSRFAVASVDPNKKALIDFSQPGHSNANLQYLGGIQSGTCYDGQAITFNPAYASIPLVIFSGGGMSYSSVTGSATTQSQAFTASSLTTSGFTASLKLVSGGTLTARTDTFTTVTSGSEYQATLTNAPAYNNTYTVNWTLSLGSSSSGTVYIRETSNTGTILFSKNYATGQNGSKSTSVTWSGATGTSVIDISLVLDGGSTGTISASTVTFTSGTAPSSVSAVPSTAPITWVAFPQT